MNYLKAPPLWKKSYQCESAIGNCRDYMRRDLGLFGLETNAMCGLLNTQGVFFFFFFLFVVDFVIH